MFSNIFQKATLLGITALTSFTITGSFMANSAQAATLDILNSEAVTGNSSSIQLPTEGTKMAAFIRRASIRMKPTSNYRVAPNETNNNKPANERTNNNQPVPVTKPAPEKTNNNKPVSATEGTKMAAFIRRASIRKKPTSNYRVAPNETNNNKPAGERTNNNQPVRVTKPAPEKTNNNKPVSATEGTKMAAFIRRASIRKKPTPNYRVAPKPTNNNKPASVTKPANERTNNNEPVPANNSASDKK